MFSVCVPSGYLWLLTTGWKFTKSFSVKFSTNFHLFENKIPSIDVLSEKFVGDPVIVCGWVTSVRPINPNVTFLTLKDHSGPVQVVIDEASPKSSSIKDSIHQLKSLKLESVICVSGIIQNRPLNQINKKLSTGTIEITATQIKILNETKNLPFLTFDTPSDTLPQEDLRLKYRYLDLRRAYLQNILRKRSEIAHEIRKYLIDVNGFVEVETPLLFKKTAEGAREFILPARQGGFFALPQSPQQFKQMLMTSGVNRYFQIAKCFRDEDLRSDRQPEFTQLDLEIAFCTPSIVKSIMEESIDRFGSDKPDLRFKYEILQLQKNYTFINNTVSENYHMDALIFYRSELQSKGIFLSEEDLSNLKALANTPHLDEDSPAFCLTDFTDPIYTEFAIDYCLNSGDVVFIDWRPKDTNIGHTRMGDIRTKIAAYLSVKASPNLNPPTEDFCFLWVEQFPLFKLPSAQKEVQRIGLESMHHPFTAPLEEDLNLLESYPLKVRGEHYDLVVNGTEIGGGSIRIHHRHFQEKILRDIMKMNEGDIEQFEHLLSSLESGCPPHGGIALGLDRLMSIMMNTTSIRDVIAFPKSHSGKDLCVRSPSFV